MGRGESQELLLGRRKQTSLPVCKSALPLAELIETIEREDTRVVYQDTDGIPYVKSAGCVRVFMYDLEEKGISGWSFTGGRDFTGFKRGKGHVWEITANGKSVNVGLPTCLLSELKHLRDSDAAHPYLGVVPESNLTWRETLARAARHLKRAA